VAATTVLTAHLGVVKTAPGNDTSLSEPPTRVQVWFDQQPSPRVSRLEVRGPEGEVALGSLDIDRQDRSIAAAIKAPLRPGRYQVTWRTAGDDGHVMRGTFAFTVQPTK
jgi:methionine-rich copper-binding protein CopC